jgi:predicted dinucleotide-binding enzyme
MKSARVLAAQSSKTRRPQTFIAGDDTIAKGKVAAIARSLKLEPIIDAGPLNHGAWLEHLGALNCYLNSNRVKAMPSSPVWIDL